MSVRSSLDEVTRLRHIVETQRLINSVPLDPDELLRVICDRSRAITGAPGAIVELVEGDEMVYRATAGSATGRLGLRLKVTSSLSGRCVRLGMPLTCEDTEVDARVDRNACRQVGVRSMIVVPLLDREVPVGVLKVVSDCPRYFDQTDLEVLEELAGFITDSLTHADRFRRNNHDASHDRLTGLANRHLLVESLERACANAARSGSPIAVFFLDLDGFKSVNDTYGHAAGDALLRTVARRLALTVRTGDIVARLGGDEFAIACEGATEDDAYRILNRVSAAVAEIAASRPEYGRLSASVGVAWRGDDGLTADELLAAADASMYRVKQAGRR